MDDEKPQRRRGRPPMNRPDRKLANLSFRLRPGMRERLQVSADERGLSISEDVERRVQASFDHEALLGDNATSYVLRALAAVIARFEDTTGKPWTKDRDTQRMVFDAAAVVLRAMVAPQDGEGPAVPTGEVDAADPMGRYSQEAMRVAIFGQAVEKLHLQHKRMELAAKRLRPSSSALQARARAAPAEPAPDPADG